MARRRPGRPKLPQERVRVELRLDRDLYDFACELARRAGVTSVNAHLASLLNTLLETRRRIRGAGGGQLWDAPPRG